MDHMARKGFSFRELKTYKYMIIAVMNGAEF